MSRDPKLTEYLGGHVRFLLASSPFSGWAVTRSVETDLPEAEIYYEFDGHGVEVICDKAERIRTIFLHRGDGETLSDVPFSLGRAEVLERFGAPEESGARGQLPVLDEYGAWDRFTLPEGSIHVEYRLDRDEIQRITLIWLDTTRASP